MFVFLFLFFKFILLLFFYYIILLQRQLGITTKPVTFLFSDTGKAYFLCDDTPPTNYLKFVKPIIWRYGYFLTSWCLTEKWALVRCA
jgi:hypothetical protein